MWEVVLIIAVVLGVVELFVLGICKALLGIYKVLRGKTSKNNN
jgi:hypothetical protein